MNSQHLARVWLLPVILLAGCERNDPQALPEAAPVQSQVEPPTPSDAIPTDTQLDAGTSQAAPEQDTNTDDDNVIEIGWDALIPEGWRMDKIMEEYGDEELSDDDPRAIEFMEKLNTFYKEAPVVTGHDGKMVKLPGFVVPLEMDTESIQEFLLVPYYGACIHTPPPPANQTVYVVTDEDRAYQGELFDIVWVTGTMNVERISSEVGDAGYRIQATKVEPYE